MRGEQGGRAVEDHDAPGLELVERLESFFDAVERRQDVEPADRDVAQRQLGECVAGSDEGSVDSAACQAATSSTFAGCG